MLAFAFAGAFRGSEVAAWVEDLTETPDGLRVLIRRSKTDQTGEGQEVAIPRGYRLRPVEALQVWLDAAGITSGPIFRGISKGDRVHPAGLQHRSNSTLIKRYAGRVGLDPAGYAAHSLRA